MYRAILVPLDRSSFAEHALPLALSLVRRAGARLDLVEVHELYALTEPWSARIPFDAAEDAAWKEKEQLYLEATASWLNAVSPITVTTAVVSGLVADSILEQAHATRPDLIVMATHARGPVGRFFLGSVADEVLRRAEVPLLVVRSAAGRPELIPEPTVDSILIPLDGSPLAEQVLPAASDLARLMEARCTLLRVVDGYSTHAVRGPVGPRASEEAEAYLEGIAARLRHGGLKVTKRVLVARHAAEAILEEARTQPCDLLALATHGHGGARRMLMGSVADQLIRGLTLPILVYRPSAT